MSHGVKGMLWIHFTRYLNMSFRQGGLKAAPEPLYRGGTTLALIGPWQSVDCLKLARQVLREVPWIGQFAGNTLHHFFGQVDSANGIHALAQPLKDEGSISPRQALIKVRERFAQRRKNLRGIEVAKRVCREVTEATRRVNVLEYPYTIRL